MKSVRLGDYATFLSGFAFKSDLFNDQGNGRPIIRIRDVVRGRSETFYSGTFDERYLVSPGEYLIGMDGEFNLARWNSEPALLNQRVCKIDTLSNDLDRDYLGRFLPAALKAIEDATPFVTVKHLSVKALNEIEIPLPPLAEQKRIAGILDAADALRAKRRESLAQLDSLLQSTFLTLFGDPVSNPMGWEIIRLGEQARRITKGQSPKWQGFGYQSHGALFVTSENVRSGYLDISTPKFVPLEFSTKLKGSQLCAGDLLINLVGASIGRSCIFSNFSGPANVNQAVAVVTITDSVLTNYIAQLLQTSSGQTLVTGRIVDAARANVSLANLRELPIPVPPLPLQRRFAAIVESVERQKARQRAHLAELDALFASLQHRAFRGEI